MRNRIVSPGASPTDSAMRSSIATSLASACGKAPSSKRIGSIDSPSPGGDASALEYEYREYTVKKGDTLWSITKRELVDAYHWPIVWQENQRINNPDLIYPGQVIMIPIGVKMPSAADVPPGVTEPAGPLR